MRCVPKESRTRRRQQRQKELQIGDYATAAVEQAESRVHAINELFCDPTFFDRTPREQVKKLEGEQKQLNDQIAERMVDWEKVEEEIAELAG